MPCTPASAFFIWMHAFLSLFFVKQILEIFTFEGGCLVFNYSIPLHFYLSSSCQLGVYEITTETSKRTLFWNATLRRPKYFTIIPWSRHVALLICDVRMDLQESFSRKNREHNNFTFLFWKVKHRNAPKYKLLMQHDYFGLFYQSCCWCACFAVVVAIDPL